MHKKMRQQPGVPVDPRRAPSTIDTGANPEMPPGTRSCRQLPDFQPAGEHLLQTHSCTQPPAPCYPHPEGPQSVSSQLGSSRKKWM